MTPVLTLYYRRQCHLCEQMLAEIYAFHGDRLEVQLADVDADASLRARFGLRVPVLAAGDRVLCVGALDREMLEDYLEGR